MVRSARCPPLGQSVMGYLALQEPRRAAIHVEMANHVGGSPLNLTAGEPKFISFVFNNQILRSRVRVQRNALVGSHAHLRNQPTGFSRRTEQVSEPPGGAQSKASAFGPRYSAPQRTSRPPRIRDRRHCFRILRTCTTETTLASSPTLTGIGDVISTIVRDEKGVCSFLGLCLYTGCCT